MERLKSYIKQALGQDLQYQILTRKDLGEVPFYLQEGYRFYQASLFEHALVLVEAVDPEEIPTSGQFRKQLDAIEHIFQRIPVLVLPFTTAIARSRLIAQGINFIVPGTQLYLPALLADLQETYKKPPGKQGDQLTPAAQAIILYYILHRDTRTEEWMLKDWAEKLNYTRMAISSAVKDLTGFSLCRVEGTRDKNIRFNFQRRELWEVAHPYFVDPVIKRQYTDAIPDHIQWFWAYESALPVYSDMNPSRQQYVAIEKGMFYSQQKANAFENLNDHEGEFCLEVWKYDPMVLVKGLAEKKCVDPLSLYLSMRNSKDERIEMALENMITQFVW